MRFINEFKSFAIKGNVIDLAVAVIIGTAFGKIVDSFVKDMIMPVMGQLIGGVDFKELYVNLGNQTYDTLELAEKAGAPLIKYGVFINSIVNFLIIALAIFVMVKALGKLKKSVPPAAPAAPAEDILLLREIRDSLKNK